MTKGPEPAANATPELTARMTEAAVGWLERIGCKPVETEVQVDEGWVADAAGIWLPTRSEAQYLHLIPPSLYSRYGNPDTEESMERRQRRREDRERAFAPLQRPLVIVHEVKATMADFRQDGKWARPWPGDVMVLSVPAGMLGASSYPGGWFVLEHAKTGAVLRLAQRGRVGEITLEERASVTLAIAMRHYNRHRHALTNDLMRKWRGGEAERRINTRLGQLARTVLGLVNGERGSFEACLHYHTNEREIRALSESTLNELRKLWRLAKPREER
jgi:hypothetical protein